MTKKTKNKRDSPSATSKKVRSKILRSDTLTKYNKELETYEPIPDETGVYSRDGVKHNVWDETVDVTIVHRNRGFGGTITRKVDIRGDIFKIKVFDYDEAYYQIQKSMIKNTKQVSDDCHIVIAHEMVDTDGNEVYEWRQSKRSSYDDTLTFQLDTVLQQIDSFYMQKYEYVTCKITEVQLIQIIPQ